MAGLLLPKLNCFGLSLTLVFLLSLTQGSHVSYPPAGTTCADLPLNKTGWEIRGFKFDTNSKLYYGQGTAGQTSFSVKNTANGYEFNCTQGSGQKVPDPNFSVRNGKVWYSCNSYCRDGDINPPLDTSFNF